MGVESETEIKWLPKLLMIPDQQAQNWSIRCSRWALLACLCLCLCLCLLSQSRQYQTIGDKMLKTWVTEWMSNMALRDASDSKNEFEASRARFLSIIFIISPLSTIYFLLKGWVMETKIVFSLLNRSGHWRVTQRKGATRHKVAFYQLYGLAYLACLLSSFSRGHILINADSEN